MPTALPGYYTTEEAAEMLGYRNGTALRQKCAQSELVAYKVGKTWLIPETQVQALLNTAVTGKGERGKARK